MMLLPLLLPLLVASIIPLPMSETNSDLKPVENLLNFTLSPPPPNTVPGTDIMSKWILYNKEVINIIVSKVVGPHAVDEYNVKPTEWLNFTRSDVLYVANLLSSAIVTRSTTKNQQLKR
jgi:hypothetical protein